MHSEKEQTLINAASSVVQAVVLAIIPFILYRFVITVIGAEQFGLWSTVIASTSASMVAELGLAGSVVKFVAKYVSRDEGETAKAMLETALISGGIAMGSFC